MNNDNYGFYFRDGIYYVRFIDENGKRRAKSTGARTKSAAKQKARSWFKQGQLTSRGDVSFEKYTEDWWVWDKCLYVKGMRAKGKKLCHTYANISRGYLKNHILPYFGNMRLSAITTKKIEIWLLELYQDEKKNLSPTTINHCLNTLKKIFKEAKRLGDIPSNPAASVSRFKKEPKEKDILSEKEFRVLFDESRIAEVWNNDIMHYTINLLAALTGMRQGEIMGLKMKFIYLDERKLEVEHSWERKYGLTEPKWGSKRRLPLPEKVVKYLRKVIELHPNPEPDSLIFCGANDINKPVYHKTILKKFYNALKKIKITEEIRKDRNITFHSWRHFYNSVLRHKVTDVRLRLLTGHKSEEMTDLYDREKFDISSYQDVLTVLERVAG